MSSRIQICGPDRDICILEVTFQHGPASTNVVTGPRSDGVPEFVNKSAASAASPGYVKFQAVIELAASATSLRGGRASGRLDHVFLFFVFWPR